VEQRQEWRCSNDSGQGTHLVADELTKPLGLDADRKRRGLTPSSRRRAAFAGLAAIVVAGGGLGWWFFSPAAPSSTEIALGDRTGSIARPAKAGGPPAKAQPSGLTEVAVPQATIRPLDDAAAPPDDTAISGVRLAALPRQDLLEKSRFGLLPRIGADGTRPVDAYARPAPPAGGLPRVAIVVGGLGVAEGSTAATLDKLPGEVTLAFAPYGENIRAALERARARGHEVLLQVPLEPYNYPAIDPGPHTLSTKASAAQNLDDLRWLLGRLTNYVGVVNYMGARFTADPAALGPILAELGKRGLLYLDDGSSAQSQAADAAGGRVPFLQADVVLDADTTPAAIDQRLDQLAALARQRGYAIGTGSAFPVTVDRIDAFAAAAEKRGIVLVPLTAILSANRS
jgi:polysaccharide deacetylase 2 family uncharacterized protein YibQ